eukprot:CAMPEP_0168604706 /NCGR_PEP_ID=MMETSP0420-20121227/15477_1 /TAXON_ID=498008 /ORGANISM="Pessonella sp." /LENGTH=295 /DNA_ID=CAMNT_0008643915 /DNA_START=635 /DNA_END=1519 /DNA_ORIENTATION=+
MRNIDFWKTIEGFHYMDCVVYTPDGLIHRHMWKWQHLEPSYIFPAAQRPEYAYIDVISASWEHVGPQGFGVDGNPHGHVYVEIGDPAGRVYSVGQYPSPESAVHIFKSPTRQLRAVLFSPDPYMVARGERTVHRVWLGDGEAGAAAARAMLAFIDGIQGYRVDDITGSIFTCDAQRHSLFDFNCSDFAQALESYAIKELKGKLMYIDDDTPLPGSKRMFMHPAPTDKKSGVGRVMSQLCQRGTQGDTDALSTSTNNNNSNNNSDDDDNDSISTDSAMPRARRDTNQWLQQTGRLW